MSLNEMQEPTEVAEARRLATALRVAEARLGDLRDERVRSITRLKEAGVSWAEIGRIYAMTPQAAMYATGHAKRTGREPSTKSKES